ncbi:GDSL-like Lipase/Acylhydrolase [compost metagenome]
MDKSQRIVFLGDSNTDNGLYIAYLDAYFMLHKPETELVLINLGVSSETVSGLSEAPHPWPRPCLHDRINRALEESRPDCVVLCYGMNDGIYHPLSEERFKAYRNGLTEAIRLAKQAAKQVIVMTPPPYDHWTKTQKDGYEPGDENEYSWKSPYPGYNEVLHSYADWVLSLEAEGKVDIAVDIFNPIMNNLQLIRVDQPEYTMGDGIHPNAAENWIIAKTLLGRIFDITFEKTPDYVHTPDTVSWFPLVLQRHRLLSSAWKEHVGHTNVNKADALPLDEAEIQGELIRKSIMTETNAGRLTLGTS